MQIPKTWKQVSLETYLDFLSLKKADYSGDHEYSCDCLSILLDVDVEEIELMKYRAFLDAQKKVSFIHTLPSSHKTAIGKYHLQLFSHITLGEFIDIEYYIEDSDNIPIILSILFKQRRKNKWGEYDFEPYNYQPNERKDFFLQQPMSDVWNVFAAYMEFRNKVLEEYKEIFSPKEPEDEETFKGLSKSEIRELKSEIEKEKQIAKFSWERFIWALCNESWVEMEKLTETKLLFVLNMVSGQKAA